MLHVACGLITKKDKGWNYKKYSLSSLMLQVYLHPLAQQQRPPILPFNTIHKKCKKLLCTTFFSHGTQLISWSSCPGHIKTISHSRDVSICVPDHLQMWFERLDHSATSRHIDPVHPEHVLMGPYTHSRSKWIKGNDRSHYLQLWLQWKAFNTDSSNMYKVYKIWTSPLWHHPYVFEECF